MVHDSLVKPARKGYCAQLPSSGPVPKGHPPGPVLPRLLAMTGTPGCSRSSKLPD